LVEEMGEECAPATRFSIRRTLKLWGQKDSVENEQKKKKRKGPEVVNTRTKWFRRGHEGGKGTFRRGEKERARGGVTVLAARRDVSVQLRCQRGVLRPRRRVGRHGPEYKKNLMQCTMPISGGGGSQDYQQSGRDGIQKR